MKKIILAITLFFTVTLNAQQAAGSYTTPTTQLRFNNTDLLQLYGAIVGSYTNSAVTTTITVFSTLTVQVISSVTSTVNLNSSAFGSAGYKWLSVQFIATSLDAADGVIKLQDSNDGTNWNDISGATGNSYSPTSLSATIKYRAKITCSGNGCCDTGGQ